MGSRSGWWLLAWLALLASEPARAQQISTAPAPQSVSLTIYRNPERQPDEKFNLNWLSGYALISETRHIEVPAGESEIRFEGVAGGIIPESAIVTGLPDGIIEKNQDAYLLSPASLLDRSLGRRVHLRRTSRATGAVREQDAVIRTGKGGAVVLQTAEGFEALRCTGIPETIVYDDVPAGLSARPTLSVRTRSNRAASATITLSYLATGFDWQANYVATLNPAGTRMDLFAWVTLANSDETSFVNADTQAVAGKPNREGRSARTSYANSSMQISCWPRKTTSDIPLQELERQFFVRRESAGTVDSISAEDIGLFPDASVTEALNRVPGVSVSRFAAQEDLGDLKLYRIPERVTVASHGQKQVALLERRHVETESFYRSTIILEQDADAIDTALWLKTRNRKQEGLGLPLPAGTIALFAESETHPVLLGEASIDDKAIDEDVEFRVNGGGGVLARLIRTADRKQFSTFLLTVINDQSQPVKYEAEFVDDPRSALVANRAISRRKGKGLWAVSIPANGSSRLVFKVKRST